MLLLIILLYMTKFSKLSNSKKSLLKYSHITSLTYDDLYKKITSKKYIEDVRLFLNELLNLYNNKINISSNSARTFLSAYMCNSHIEVVSNNDTHAKNLQLIARNMINLLEDTTQNEYDLHSYNKFIVSYHKYLKCFHIWKEREGLIMARPVIKSYIDIDLVIENTTLTEENIRDLRQVQKKLKENVKMLGGEEAMTYLNENKLPYFKDESMFVGVEKTIRKAFWDVFEENIDGQKFEQLTIFLDEIKTIIIECLPPNNNIINMLNEVIDIKLINQMIENKQLDINNIHCYIKFLIDILKQMQSFAEDKNTLLFEENIKIMIENNEKLSSLLKYFFEFYFEKIEKIKSFTLKLREHVKNKN
jgi:hypothetical protein